MGRPGLAFAAAAAVLISASQGYAAERRAVVQGVEDHGLRDALQIAIGDEKAAPANRLDARRRARQAAESATALLRSEGYYDYQVTPDIGEGDRPQPVVKIDVGPRTHLAPPEVDWVGDAPPADVQAAVLKAIALKPGAPARAADVLAGEGRAVAAVQQRGYANAKTADRQVTVEHIDETMHLVVRIAAGKLVRLDGLKVEKKGRTRATWLKSLVPWKPGEVYKPDKVAELERRLLDTQAYESVSVALAPEPGPDGLTPVLVNLVDRSRHSFEFSAGYSTTEGADINIALSTYNPFGRGDTLTYEARYASLANTNDLGSLVGVKLALPDFTAPGRILTVEPAFFQSVAYDYVYVETGGRIAGDITQRYGKTSFITGGASIAASEVNDKETGTIDILTFRLLAAFTLDRSDNPLDPHYGYKIDARVEPTQIEGDVQMPFVKLQAEAMYYLPIGAEMNTVLAFRGHVGSIVGGRISSLPAPDRFYAGGGGSVRGYVYQSVGPHYADNNPVGGLSLVEESVEVRHRFTNTLGGVLFFDAGSVGTQIQPDFAHTDTAVGVGFRYNLGFAPLRADLAFPLQNANNKGISEQPFQIYISIGQSF